MKTKEEILRGVGSQLVQDRIANTDSYQYPLNGKGIYVAAIFDADEDVWTLLMSNNGIQKQTTN